MHSHYKRCLLLVFICLVATPDSKCAAQSQDQTALLRGEGAFLRGLGSYNLNTARADSINLDTLIRWKKELRNDQRIYTEQQDRNPKSTTLTKGEADRLRQLREYELRNNPKPADIQNGQALNALLYDLTDPGIPSSDWASKKVSLPKELSVKDLIFRFTPPSSASATSKALSRGVIALSRLEVEGDKWPTVMKQDELKEERRRYEVAYTNLKDNLINDKQIHEALSELDLSLEALKAKVEMAVPAKRGYRTEALRYVRDLNDATRMFDATTVDYSREILVDTKEHDATTVSELVAFVLKFRLQFATAERHQSASRVYGPVYKVMQQQVKELKIQAPMPLKFITTKSGLKFRILNNGEGIKPTPNSTIVCHYRGWLNGGQEFDNSYKRNEPSEFQMNKVIKGWIEGVQLINAGGTIELEVPSNLAYGEKGAGKNGEIPPNATLHFIIELIDVK